MLESVHKQKMALAAYATEHGGIAMLNSGNSEKGCFWFSSQLKKSQRSFQRIQLVFSCDSIGKNFRENAEQT